MAFTTAGDIKLAKPLQSPLSGIAGKSRSRLQDILGQRTDQIRQDQLVSGRPMGEYTGFALGQASDAAGRGVDNSLYGVLGDASLRDYRSNQDYQRQMQLAKEIGDLNRPSLIQEISGLLTGAGTSAGSFKNIYDQFSNRPKISTTRSTAPALNYYDPGTSGYGRYQY
jgi:hypothetical protein